MKTILSFDGHGINEFDEHRSRIATFTDRYKTSKYGPLFAASIDMLEALKTVSYQLSADETSGEPTFMPQIRAVIAKAEGKE